MTDTDVMQREPSQVPVAPGIFALANKRRRFAYLAWTSNLQKRSHALAHMLAGGKSSIKNLPMHPAGEYLFIVLKAQVPEASALASLAQLRRPFEDKGYTLIDGMRDPVPLVVLDGRRVSLVEALATVPARQRPKYTTAWRRLERGWSLPQVLGLEPPPSRWGRQARSARGGA